MLTGDNKSSELDLEIINDTMMEECARKLSNKNELYLIHDPCDIRKPHSTSIENIGQVRSLDGKIINGYSSYNIIAITPSDKSINLFSHDCYSNKDDKFLKVKELKKIENGKKFEHEEQAQKKYDEGDWFNKISISKKATTQASNIFKKKNAELSITHILDREFDTVDFFDYITNLNDSFVIRAKKSRVLTGKQMVNGKNIKLIDAKFENTYVRAIQKMTIKGKRYQDIELKIEWMCLENYTAVRVLMYDRNGKNIFKNPMLLITNKKVVSNEEALLSQ